MRWKNYALLVLALVLLISASTFAVNASNQEKISSSVLNALENEAKVPVIISFKSGTSKFSILSTNSSQDANLLDDTEITNQYISKSTNTVYGEVTDSAIEKLRENPNVKEVYYRPPFHTLDTTSNNQINATSVWPNTFSGTNLTGEGRTICILDTGINYTHPDLGGCSQASFLAGTCAKVLGGYDFVNTDTNPMDDNGHGTHVAGIAAANGSTMGVAPGAKIISIKVCDNTGSCGSGAITDGIDWCVGNSSFYNISVISISLGGGNYSGYCDSLDGNNLDLTPAINSAIAKNITVTIATGNAGLTANISSPACIQNATSVGSVGDTDLFSSFSNRNNLTDVFAPGETISSTASGGSSTCASSSSLYKSCSGTSMSTPHVAGAVAILQQARLIQLNRILTQPEVETALKNFGNNLTDTGGSNLIFPRLNVYRSIDSLTVPTFTWINRTNVTLSGQNVTINLTASDAFLGIQSANITINSTQYIMNVSGNSYYYVYTAPNVQNVRYNVTFFDSVQSNTTETVILQISDITLPVPSFSASTPANNSKQKYNTAGINVSISDNIAIDTTRINLFNTTAIYNSSFTVANITLYYVNFTGLPDGAYLFNATTNDSSGNVNNTETRLFLIDTLLPVQSFTAPTQSNNSKQKFNTLAVNVSYTELNPDTLVIRLFNTTGQYNVTAITSFTGANNGSYTFNFTGLPDGAYLFNATTNDSSGNVNNTETRLFLIDTLPATFTNISSLDLNYSLTSYFNISWQDDITISSVWIEFNGTNYTGANVTNVSNIYSFNRSAAAGNYTLRWYANDTSNNVNSTNLMNVTISRINPILNLTFLISGITYTSDITIDNDTSVNITATSVGEGNIDLYSNGSLIGRRVALISNLTNFSVATYNITALYNATQNYSGSFITYFITVQAADQAPVGFKVSPANNTYTNNSTVTFTANATDTSLSNATIFLYTPTGTVVDINSTNVTGTFNTTIWIYSLSSDGNYTWNVRFTDNRSNSNFTSGGNFTVVVDTTKPTARVRLQDTSITDAGTTNINCSGYDLNLVSAKILIDDVVKSTNSSGNITTYLFPTHSAGSYKATCLMTDLAGNVNSQNDTITVTATSSGSSGSSGGSSSSGGGAAVESDISNYVFSSLTAGQTVKVIPSDRVKEITGLVAVVITTKTGAANVKINVLNASASKVDKSLEKTDKIYHYIQIDHENLDNSAIQQVNITFEVKTSWLKANNVSKENVTLKRYINGTGWEKILAKNTTETSLIITYKATSKGLSFFAISAETGKILIPDAVNSTSAATNKTASPGTSTGKINWKYVIIATVIVALIILLSLLYLIWKNNKR